ncbi:MAG: hypothetical protein K4571_18500 [Deltaproteobacteria bacterium]
MLRYLKLAAVLSLVMLFVSGAQAEMRIQLKGGRSMTIPVAKEDVVSIHFDDGQVSGLKNFALTANGGRITSGFTAWSTPRSVVNDGITGPDAADEYSQARDGIAAYSFNNEAFKVEFSRPVNVRRIGIVHKFGGGGGGRHIMERARIVFANGVSQEIQFSDKYAMQYVDIVPVVTDSVRVEPVSFYRHKDGRWGIIEFEALGEGN